MKTHKESELIDGFCKSLSELFCDFGNIAEFEYDNDSERVLGTVNGKALLVNVHMDSVEAAARDIIRTVGRVI